MVHPTKMQTEAGLHPWIEDHWIQPLWTDLANHIDQGWPESGDKPELLVELDSFASAAPISIREMAYG